MKDVELSAVRSHLRLCTVLLVHRLTRLENQKVKLSLYYATLQHTKVLLNLAQELEGFALQDPDMWDDEPESIPF